MYLVEVNLVISVAYCLERMLLLNTIFKTVNLIIQNDVQLLYIVDIELSSNTSIKRTDTHVSLFIY